MRPCIYTKMNVEYGFNYVLLSFLSKHDFSEILKAQADFQRRNIHLLC